MSNNLVDQRFEQIAEASYFIAGQIAEPPRIGLVLGSGLGILADEIENPDVISYAQIPNFPVSTVVGHAGELAVGKLGGQQVVAMKGRFHMYEGYSAETVTFPIRVLRELGVETLIVTNAAGGVNTAFQAGDLMLIRDHLNLMGRNPLVGPNDSRFGPRFPDLSAAYSSSLRETARQAGQRQGIVLQEGVYAGVLGPCFETPAEIRMLRMLGADGVGMSTVPEVIVARHMGVEVLGISCITNMAAGILDQPLSHDEVIEAADRVKPRFLALLREIIGTLGKE